MLPSDYAGADDELRWLIALISDGGMRLGEAVGLLKRHRLLYVLWLKVIGKGRCCDFERRFNTETILKFSDHSDKCISYLEFVALKKFVFDGKAGAAYETVDGLYTNP